MERTLKGKILKGVGGLYTVRLLHEDGSIENISCRARGVFRHQHIELLAGDNVTVIPDEHSNSASKDGGAYVIDEIGERKNSLIRPPLANLDYLFVTMAAASPVPILTTIDKLIAIAEHNEIEPVIVITKRELNEKYADVLENIYRSCGFEVFSLSAAKDENVSPIESFIKEALSGKTAAFAGASGIGKSTLMNRLFPELSLSTFEISKKIQRGRHTTRQVELFPLSDTADCGYLADTPGFSMLDFERFDFFDKEDLPSAMREFNSFIGECRYTKCSHTKEDGCAILEAVKNGKIPKSRHESYLDIYETLKKKKKWD
jgi:ribosome biogenesis GTPase